MWLPLLALAKHWLTGKQRQLCAQMWTLQRWQFAGTIYEYML